MNRLLDPPRIQQSSGSAAVVAGSGPSVGAGAGCGPASPNARLVAGRYRLRALLGRGGMGRVWLAEDELLHRPVALKQDLLSDPTSGVSPSAPPSRLLSEACAAANVNHQGAVTIYDVVIDDGHHWIVMEPLFGRTLAEAIARQGPLHIAQVTAIGLGLLSVLQSAHRGGIVHCDVKPSNVHICDDGRVVLTDFGLAHRLDGDGGNTQIFAASPVYTAPERLRGGIPEPASDLFSVGATLFAAVEGKPPFHGAALFDTVVAVVEGQPAPFLRAGRLRPVLEGLLAKSPEDRLGAEQAQEALFGVQQECQLATDGSAADGRRETSSEDRRELT
jgi:eukaryotic-like serine/threonine-protein kinase